MGQIEQLNPVILTNKVIPDSINEVIEKAYKARIQDIKKSVRLINRAKSDAQKIDLIEGVRKSEAYLAFFKMIQGEFDNALKLSNQLLSYYNDHTDDYSTRALLHYTIGSVYYKSDSYHIGLKHLLQCLALRRQIEDKAGESQALKAIGTIYEYYNDYESAEEAYEQCRKISNNINDKLGESNACNPLSGIYLKREKINAALETAERSIKLKIEAGDKRGLAFAYHAKAKVFLKQEYFPESEDWFLKSLHILIEVDETLGIAMCQQKLGELYFNWEKFDEAKKYLHKSLESGHRINSKMILIKCYHFLYQIYKLENQPIKALDYLEKHLENKQTVINDYTRSMIKSFKAISKIEMLERESRIIKEKNRHIEEKNAELDTFVYRVSHDLRGPIASLMGLYEIAKYDVQDPTAINYLDLYNGQIQRLNSIILDLINLTRIKDWRIKTHKIEFASIISNIINSYKYVRNFENIEFEVKIQDGIEFLSDKSIISTIFQNLIENSIKYSRDDIDAKVKVMVQKDFQKKNLFIEIIDNGLGIQKQYHNKVFEMFFRANEDQQGTGLGLYILKYAVDKLKGSIKLESEHWIGTRFLISIPC